MQALRKWWLIWPPFLFFKFNDRIQGFTLSGIPATIKNTSSQAWASI